MALGNDSTRRDIRFWLVASIFLLFLLFSRLWDLGGKPYHHDESLYAIESWRYATQGTYSFNPMLHGPLLFHLQALLFKILPINDVTGRLPVVLAGLGLALLGWFLFPRRPLSLLVWLGAIGFSPILGYFSRFLGMDALMAFLATALLLAWLRLWRTERVRYLYVAAALMACMYCTKLNSLFYFFIFFTFAAIWMGYDASVRMRIWAWRRFRWHWLGAFALATAVFVLLFSSLGTNWAGVWDGLYRKMFPYWIKQHSIQRIKGPYHYYIPYLFLYELPTMLLLAFAFFSTRFSTRQEGQLTRWFLTGLTLLWGVTTLVWKHIAQTMDRLFHMEHPFHPVIAVGVLGATVFMLRHHLRRREYLHALAVHWAAISFLLYSYAGEKIPWLNVHMVLPLCLYLALWLPDVLEHQLSQPRKKWALMAVGATVIGWQAMNTYRATHLLAADPRESLVYTHTSWEMVDLVNNLDHLGNMTEAGKGLNVQVVGASAWPLYWYLRSYKRWFYQNIDMEREPWVIVNDWEAREKTRALVGDAYYEERFKLREWWVPDLAQMTLANTIRYYFTRKPFSVLGSQDVAVYVRKDLWPFWPQLSSGDSQINAPRSNDK